MNDYQVSPLSDLGLIEARGADAAAFLHGQLCNDVLNLPPQRSQLTAYLNPQGRVLAIMRLWRQGDGFFLQLPADMLESILKRLQMFVLRAHVTLRAARSDYVCHGVYGPDAEHYLSAKDLVAPGAVDEFWHHPDNTVLRVPGATPRFVVWTRAGAPLPVAPRHGDAAWQMQDILAGVPVIHRATSGEFVPQMLNLDLLGAVNFKKGCYPGQEIVARMQYLATLKRRTYALRALTARAPAPGAALINDAGAKIGTVLLAQPLDEDTTALLAVMDNQAMTQAVRYADDPAVTLVHASLPYALPTA